MTFLFQCAKSPKWESGGPNAATILYIVQSGPSNLGVNFASDIDKALAEYLVMHVANRATLFVRIRQLTPQAL
ncbi:hypothetical protein KCTCHS21_00340 [Cohnella abietis]|uniref:Uncharacterized protein n=1 Tax=Cohnella abietis TaxID=2507935 RepID=A0A3T1CY01_9BACL|nr:hypothetical protein KCTCHS21_00340 [Cohnella abietis]